MSNILISSAGRRVSLVKAFQNELSNLLSRESLVFCADMNPKLSAACNSVKEYFKVPPVTSNQYVNSLIEISLKKNIKIIIPTIDTELKILSQNKNIFFENGIICLCSDIDFIEICSDKRLTNQFFLSKKIDVPQEYSRDNLRLPVFVKPFNGSSSENIHLIKNYNELNMDLLNNPDMMFLEYINPKEFDEYTLDIYFNRNHKICSIVPRLRIETRTGEISKGLTKKNNLISFIRDRLDNLDSVIGCLTLQLFANKNITQIYGIEINPRFGGGYPLSYLAGANYPSFIIREYFFDQTVDYDEDWEDNLLMLRYDEEILVHNYNE